MHKNMNGQTRLLVHVINSANVRADARPTHTIFAICICKCQMRDRTSVDGARAGALPALQTVTRKRQAGGGVLR